ncbi:MAG: ABC transporter substrate-binding protein [Coriobacteriia bacterium]|nr:ABC transporter substrate-binding protein [Coriobacteriia bacterium]
MYGTAEVDGNLVNPGKQVLSGKETTVYCIICNNEDAVMSNKDLRIALSYAINRQAICTTVLENSRTPVDDVLPPSLAGYQAGTWEHCPAESDKDKAAEYLDKAGYPADANGKRNLSLTLSTNTGSGNEDIFTMIQADLQAVGIDATIETQEWAAYLDALTAGDYQIGRMGFTADAPSAYSYLQDAFFKGAGSNYCKYDNPEFEAALNEAAGKTDADERAAGYQAADKIVAEDFPLIPLCVYGHGYVCSGRVNNLLMNMMGYARFNRCWLSA